MKRTIGILGGMGPEATGHFFNLLVKRTAAAADQEHIPILLWNNPRIPPRTDGLLGLGPSPLPVLLSGVRILERGGAGLIVMPCITAHFWAAKIREFARVPFINLIEETVRHARRSIPDLETAALLASPGTARSGIFHAPFKRAGVTLISPEPADQERVTEAIFGPRGVKAGGVSAEARRAVRGVAQKLIAGGAQAVIAGCTETPLLLQASDLSVPFLDPLEIGAAVCIRKAGYSVREPQFQRRSP